MSYSILEKAISMVRDGTIKLYRRVSKKRYLGGKYLYAYERIYLPIPSKLQKAFKPFLGQPLKIDIITQNSCITITLKRAKTFQHAEQAQAKTLQGNNKRVISEHSKT